MARKLNNAHLRDIADAVDPSGTTDGKMLNNEYLERIADGIGSITGVVDASTGKVLSSMLEGVIDASNLPSYVDDVIEGYYHDGAFYADSTHETAMVGESGKIYVDVPSGTTYRWGGSAYAAIGGGQGASIDLGITGSTAGQFAKVAAVDANGAPTAWTTEALKHTLTVTCVTQDNVTVTGQTVTVRQDGPDGTVWATIAYEGQPVSLSLPEGFVWHASVTSDLAHHFNPTTASGVIRDADVSATLTYSDFSTIRTAADIKAALDSDIDLTDLVGEQISCSYGSSTYAWDVVDYDSYAGEVTLLGADCAATAANILFEPQQALAWFEDGLPAGDYSFQNGNATYYFTLTKSIPAGGQLRATTTTFQTWESYSATATLETGTVSTTEIVGATLLGKCGTETGAYPLNHMDRVNSGSNNYGESFVHAWLNFSGAANEQVPRVTRFSRPYAISYPGFLGNLDPDFVACVADTAWKCSSTSAYECPSSMGGTTTKGNPYTVTSKFALASEKELLGTYGGVDAGDSQFDLFVGATDDERKRYRGNSAQYWWLRSPYPGLAYYVRNVSTSSGVYHNFASSSVAAVPACKIRKSS